MLSGQDIYKSFAGNHVLKGVDIKIAPGEITCLIGPSSGGKTTLLRAMALLDYPDQGRIRFDDRQYDFPLKEENIAPPWPQITAVFQSLFLWPHLTLRENIMLPARQRNAKAQEDLKGLIALFEMESFIDNFPNEASVGQRQRAALARALILNPEYILMDEITSALDVEQTAKILTKLAHLKQRGIGILLITHQLGFTRSAADQIIFLESGKVAEQGGPEILSNPKTQRLRQFLSLAELAA